MTITKENLETKATINKVRATAIRQDSKVNLSLFNYCFLVYYYLINEIKKNASYARGITIDIGSGSSPFQSYFSPYVEKYLRHEHPDAAKSNVIYDCLSELPEISLSDSSVDTVLSFSVLEHVSKPFETIKEFKRILKNNGIFMISVPQYWHLHDEPHDYYRFTKHILKEKITREGFEILYLKELGRSFATVGQVFCNALILLFDLEHVKNIYNFLKRERGARIEFGSQPCCC